MFKPLKPRMRTHYTNLGNPTSMPIFYWTIDIIFWHCMSILVVFLVPPCCGSVPCDAYIIETQAPKMNMIEHGMWLSLCVPSRATKINKQITYLM